MVAAATPQRVGKKNAALPLDIRAFGEQSSHRLAAASRSTICVVHAPQKFQKIVFTFAASA
jgi:hypothetical protein